MRKLPPTIFLFLFALCLNGMADTITLKDGTTVEGKITQENDTQVTISVHVSDTISDDQVLQRADIVKIEKTPEDGIAFDQMKNWKPDPWAMLSPETYKATIGQLQAFLDKYPQSSHVADVKTMLATFQDEQKHQQAGEVKLYGLWISPKEAAARAVQIQAQTIYLKMQAIAAQGDLIGALNAFDQLEKGFPNTRVYPAAIEKAKALQTELLLRVSRAADNLKLTDAKWQQGVTITAEPAKSQIIAARQAENAQNEAILEAATKAGTKWPPLIPQSQKSLDALISLLNGEKARLAALPVEKMNASIEESDKASESVSANDLNAATTFLVGAKTLWPANEEADYLLTIISDIKAARAHPEKAAGPVKVALRPTPKLAATATPTPKPRPSATPVVASTPEPEEKPSLVDFFFTIKGAATVVGCLLALIGIVSFLQKRKQNKVEEDEEEES
jgi:hypothetical protein